MITTNTTDSYCYTNSSAISFSSSPSREVCNTTLEVLWEHKHFEPDWARRERELPSLSYMKTIEERTPAITRAIGTKRLVLLLDDGDGSRQCLFLSLITVVLNHPLPHTRPEQHGVSLQTASSAPHSAVSVSVPFSACVGPWAGPGAFSPSVTACVGPWVGPEVVAWVGAGVVACTGAGVAPDTSPGAQYLLLSLRIAPHAKPEQHGVSVQTALT